MLTLILGVFSGVAVSAVLLRYCAFSTVWAMILGLLALFVIQIIAALFLRFKTKKIQLKLQNVMLETQKRLEQKQQIFIRQHNTNQKLLMMQMEAEQKKGLEAALAVCGEFRPLCKWNLMLEKQINTMRMAFYYQMKDWENVDKLMPKCVFLEPQSICMKLARMYKKNDPKLDKFYKKKSRMLRKDGAVLPAATYSWILLKLGRTDDALKVLTDAKAKSSNEVISRNRDAIANNKLKQFSNSGLAEQWYALGLEEPKMPKIQQRVAYR